MSSESILRASDVCRRIGLSISTLQRLRHEGNFCRAIPIGKRAIGYLASDVDAWIAARAEAASRHAGVIAE